MFQVEVVSKIDVKRMMLTEQQLINYVGNFIVSQAMKLGRTTTSMVNNGETYTWHITYQKPN